MNPRDLLAAEYAAEATVQALRQARERVRAAELAQTTEALHGRRVSQLMAALYRAQRADLEARLTAAECQLTLARSARERAERAALGRAS